MKTISHPQLLRTLPLSGAFGAALLLITWSTFAATNYVWQGSPSPTPPYSSWATAAHVIQDAVDAAAPGDTVLVTNGVHATGGDTSSRVAVNKPLSLQSVNGPEFTVILGSQAPEIRCAYLTNGASLSGFTLTNGSATGDGGGVRCFSAAVVTNCLITGNSADWGGGASGGTLNNCTLTSNSAPQGGGMAFGTLNNCSLNDNTAGWGGGAYECTLNNCTLTGNSAEEGGGARDSTLNNCTLTGNSAALGGGAQFSSLNNCIVYFNLAPGGANYDWFSTLNYCCTTPLPAEVLGNITADPQIGNISADPELASTSHLSADSPCIGAGSAAYATGTDIDGDAWASPPAIGCDEYYLGAVTGVLSVVVSATYTNVAPGLGVDFVGTVNGHAAASAWDFGDGTVASNQPYTSHAYSTTGDYEVNLRAYNDSNPGGISATVMIHVAAQPVHYVSANSANPVPPYTSWSTAAATIQDAVDAATTAGALILVTNGTYNSGGKPVVGLLTNRVAVDKPLTLQSVNGPEVTIIEGYQVPGTTNGDGAIRCAYLTGGATVSGFTLTNGATRNEWVDWRVESGGGVWCESASVVVSNCILINNSAFLYGGAVSYGTLNDCILNGNATQFSWSGGGGAFGSTLNDCHLTGNATSSKGGGVYSGTLNNCTLTNNSAFFGGGARESTLNYCTLIGNSAQDGSGADACVMNNCTLTGNSGARAVSGGTLNDCTLNGNLAGVAYRARINRCIIIGNTGTSVECLLSDCLMVGNSAVWGGGAYRGTLKNCTVIGNSATKGGGVHEASLTNCIVYFNTAPEGANYNLQFGGVLNYTCTTPLPTNGIGNIAVMPLFVDTNGWADLRLQSNSPCINSGNNSYAMSSTDLDGSPRITGGTVDMGAYEYQTPGSVISYAWLQQYGLPKDGSADYAYSDADPHNNWQEWKTWTDPTDELSALKLLTPQPETNGTVVSWQSVLGHSYSLERAANASGSFSLLQGNITGQAGVTSFTDSNTLTGSAVFYRVGVPE